LQPWTLLRKALIRAAKTSPTAGTLCAIPLDIFVKIMLIYIKLEVFMNIYLILAYPNHDGLCYNIYTNVLKGFIEAGHEIRTTDLYEEKFNPVLVFNNEKRRRDLKNDPEMEKYRENIIWANHLVFIYPIWWSGMPAILKGFIDRVFASGFAYEYKGMLVKGFFGGKSAWIINTNDTPYLYAKLFLKDYGNILKKQILALCGIKKIKQITFSGIRFSNRDKIGKWLEILYGKARNYRFIKK
jgi:NAD(P)H dehydrogenase (quinone)